MKAWTELKALQKAKNGEKAHICAFGASNTQRHAAGMHWFDYLELGFKNNFGGHHAFLNAGIGGNKAIDLLDRFDRDVAFFKPDLTILTIGGNDAQQAVPPEMFAEHLRTIYKRLTDLGSEVIFQTYYACDLERCNENAQRWMPVMMQIVREVAAELGTCLSDNDRRWKFLKQANLSLYRTLMRDGLHVNSDGNQVIGLDLLRRFEIPASFEEPFFRTGFFVQALIDELEEKSLAKG